MRALKILELLVRHCLFLSFSSDEKKPVHNSPLRPIQNESEVSLDSPIKQTKKQRKRIESSSEEEENGSPKQGDFFLQRAKSYVHLKIAKKIPIKY